MSFILDALKKSENERQRQGGPALYEVKLAPPRSRVPLWGGILAVLLAVNALVMVWLLGGSGGTPEQAAVAAPPEQAAQAAQGAAPVYGPAAPPPAAQYAPPFGYGPPPYAAQPYPAQPPYGAQGYGPQPYGPQPGWPVQAMPPNAQGAPELVPGFASGTVPEDFLPAVPPRREIVSQPAPTAAGLPSYEDVALSREANVPELRLDLHAYAAQPQERFVMINMRRLREGDTLPDGIRVESITPEGAILSFRNRRFLLQRD
jgi:general secretion pathway protein B